MEDVEARFAHLLQPIRDLTKNWEVDVAAQLGEYLEELDQICISFDEGKTTMNFVEAALLIQGSACVYSKKIPRHLNTEQELGFKLAGPASKHPTTSRRGPRCRGSSSPHVCPQAEVVLQREGKQKGGSTVGSQCSGSVLKREVRDGNREDVLARKSEQTMSRGKKNGQKCGCQPRPRPQQLPVAGPYPVLQSLGLTNEEAETGRAAQAQRAALTCCPVFGLLGVDGPGTSPEGPMPAGGDEDEDAEGVAELPEVPLEPQESRSPQQSTAQPRRFELRERREALEPVSQLKETPDPWQSLDPFSSLDSKPFKKGKPYSVPACVEEVPGQKRKRKGAAKLQDFHQWYLATYADHADSRRLQKKGPSFADMEVLYWKHVREQLETLRKLQRREAAKRWLPRAEEELWPVEEDRLEDSLEELGAAADDFLEPEEYAEPDRAKPEDAADLEAEAMPASLSYEELVRKNVELFITTSQKFVQETELSQRVRDWEDSIQPLLQEQEQHVPFDIHLYGDQMVSRFSQLHQWCPFAKLVAGQPAFEVCRAMLASLQLANDHTGEITQQPGLDAAVDTMSLRLLTHQRHKRFQTYTAPSMAQP
uniref:Condensin-2 complex subunit H2 n=1 Tax=Myotis lucifugus TaxID=59463 RepID=G1PGD3_MYOLU